MYTKGIGRTILVVDDDALILQCVRRILEQASYVVLTSQSGDDALDIIERGDARVDLMVTDIVMPGSIDGFSLAAEIRQKEAKLPVLFITGTLSEDDPYVASLTRKKLLLRKPFSPRQLVEFIDWHFAGNFLEGPAH